MTDLTTEYLGFTLRSPLVASASPMTATLERLTRLDDAGVGAVVLPSLFEEEVETEALTFARHFEAGSGVNPEASGYFPSLNLDHLMLERQLHLTESAAQSLSIPVIASLNGTTPGGWVRYAQDLVDAGAHAIELNMYDVVADVRMSAAAVEARYLDLVREVRSAITVPLAVKLSPYFTSVGHFAAAVVEAGADGLVLFNRFYQPDLDLTTLDVTPTLELSHPGEMRLPLRWIALLRPHLPNTSLALTTGARHGTDVAKGLLAGADVVMAAAELLRRGPERAVTMLAELTGWMVEAGYESVTQLRGSVAQNTADDPTSYERAQYHRVLHSWGSTATSGH